MVSRLYYSQGWDAGTPVNAPARFEAGSLRRAAAYRTPRRSCAKAAITLTDVREPTSPVRLVVDTNVVLKVYLDENLADEAQGVLDAGRDGEAEPLTSTLIHRKADRSHEHEQDFPAADELQIGFDPLSRFFLAFGE